MCIRDRFWANEYHIDGFRFDLMGIHDIATMNCLRKELLKIDPTIFVDGEGWLAADSPLPPEKRAVKENVGQMEGIAAVSYTHLTPLPDLVCRI